MREGGQRGVYSLCREVFEGRVSMVEGESKKNVWQQLLQELAIFTWVAIALQYQQNPSQLPYPICPNFPHS